MTTPGFRPVDPDAEAARLVEERNRRAAVASWPVIVEEIQQVPDGEDGDGMIFVTLRVTAERFSPVPSDLGSKLVEVIAENWPIRNG